MPIVPVASDGDEQCFLGSEWKLTGVLDGAQAVVAICFFARLMQLEIIKLRHMVQPVFPVAYGHCLFSSLRAATKAWRVNGM